MEHKLKCWPEFYAEIVANRKTVEVRLNDRKYAVGDILTLQEYEPEVQKYTGRETKREVTHVLKGGIFGVKDKHAALSIKPIGGLKHSKLEPAIRRQEHVVGKNLSEATLHELVCMFYRKTGLKPSIIIIGSDAYATLMSRPQEEVIRMVNNYTDMSRGPISSFYDAVIYRSGDAMGKVILA